MLVLVIFYLHKIKVIGKDSIPVVSLNETIQPTENVPEMKLQDTGMYYPLQDQRIASGFRTHKYTRKYTAFAIFKFLPFSFGK